MGGLGFTYLPKPYKIVGFDLLIFRNIPPKTVGFLDPQGSKPWGQLVEVICRVAGDSLSLKPDMEIDLTEAFCRCISRVLQSYCIRQNRGLGLRAGRVFLRDLYRISCRWSMLCCVRVACGLRGIGFVVLGFGLVSGVANSRFMR